MGSRVMNSLEVFKNHARFMPDILNINTKESCIINQDPVKNRTL